MGGTAGTIRLYIYGQVAGFGCGENNDSGDRKPVNQFKPNKSADNPGVIAAGVRKKKKAKQ